MRIKSSKSKKRASLGNTTALVVAFLGILLLLLIPIFLNFNQLTASHKEGQTAIDAAALQAAKDMGRVVVDGPFGRIALVDDPQPSSNGYPVRSLNNVYAQLRFDAIVANAISNTTLLYLVQQDLNQTNQAAQQLKNRLINGASGGASCYDKNGGVINIYANARNAYINNKVRSGLEGKAPQSFSLSFGRFNSNNSYVPVPTPSSMDTTIGANIFNDPSGAKYYKANVAVPLPGLTGQSVTFQPATSQIGVVSNTSFVALSGNEAPSAVQVSAVEGVRAIAKQGNQQSMPKGNMLVSATASPGAGTYTAGTMHTSGSLVLNFPQGFPVNNGTVSFNSLKGIMNASQLGAGNNPTSPYTGWNASNTGKWYTAQNGPVPGNGSLQQSAFKSLSNRSTDDPSVSLAFLTYDWLRSMGNRPSLKSVVDAMNFDFKAAYAGNNSSPTIFSDSGIQVFPSALAAEDSATTNGQITPILRLSDNDSNDPRNLQNYANDPASYQRQQMRMWGYQPAGAVLDPKTMIGTLTNDGSFETTDGNPGSTLNDFYQAITETNQVGVATLWNVMYLLQQKESEAGQADKDGKTQQMEMRVSQKILDQNPRLAAALSNAMHCVSVTGKMKENLRTLTGGGVMKKSNNHYVVMGADFFPANKAALVEQLKGEAPIPTGQSSMAGPTDWCTPAATNKASKLNFYKHSSEPVIGKATSKNSWYAKAYAANPEGTIPSNNLLKFVYHLSNASSPGNGKITLHPMPTSPFAGVPILKGQASYQNTNAIIVASASDPNAQVQWQVQARDEYANAYPDQGTSGNGQPTNPSSAATHFTNFGVSLNNSQWCNSGFGQGCPPLVSEWSINCPVVQAPPPPPPPPATPPCDPTVKFYSTGQYAVFAGPNNWNSPYWIGGLPIHGIFAGMYYGGSPNGWVSILYYIYSGCHPQPLPTAI